MATREFSILGRLMPDTSNKVYPSTTTAEMSLTNAKGVPCYVWEFPAGADIGMEGIISIPLEFVQTPKIVVRGIIDGTPANTMAFGAKQITGDVSASFDTAYEAEDLVNIASWTGYADEDYFEAEIALTPTATMTPGAQCPIFAYRDDSVDTTTFNVLITDILFQFADA